MSNTYFQFKQFRVEQSRCAMKVGTDGVLLGAWADVSAATHILDIGTGTGLLALMLAQRQPNALLTAIEIDASAAQQAAENFANSPWHSRLECRNVSLQEFLDSDNRRFDHIVSNPPYFNHSLKNPDKQRAQARHTDTLSYEELMQAAQLLTEGGLFSLVLPYQSADEVLSLAGDAGLFCSRQTDVLPKPDAAPKRVLLELRKQPCAAPLHSQLVIELDRHVHTPQYAQLTKDFYLDKE